MKNSQKTDVKQLEDRCKTVRRQMKNSYREQLQATLRKVVKDK